MYKIHTFKHASKGIIDYFFNQIYEIMDSKDPYKVKDHIGKVIELQTINYLQAHITLLEQYTFYATVGKPESKQYEVSITSKGRAICSCPSFKHRHFKNGGFCKHIIALALMLENPPDSKMIAVDILNM